MACVSAAPPGRLPDRWHLLRNTVLDSASLANRAPAHGAVLRSGNRHVRSCNYTERWTFEGVTAVGILPALISFSWRVGRRARGRTGQGATAREPAVAARGSATTSAARVENPGEDPQSAALEEWLLGLDLPQPLRPVLGSSAWASFAAALAQFALVAGLGALGTLLEQGRPPEFYAEQYPSLSGVILSLGLDHVYTAPLFLGLLVWLAASLAACTGTTQLPMAKMAQRFRFRTAKSMRRSGHFMVRVNCPTVAPTADVGRQPGSAAHSHLLALQGLLSDRGFVVRTDNEAAPSRLSASRGLLGKFAPMFVHVALLLCLAGGAVGIFFGASSEVMLKDGGEADLGTVLEQGRRAKGTLYDLFNPSRGLLQGTLVRCQDFRIAYRDDGEIDQFYSKLVLEDAKTKDRLLNEEIYVNKPLRFGGATLYQADWALDRLQLYVNGQPVVVPLKSLPGEAGVRVWGAFLPKEFVTAEDPSTVKKIKDPNDGIVLLAENMRNVQVYGSDKNLAGILRSPDAKLDRKMAGMPVQFGEEITVEGTAKLRLDRIVGSTGLIVKNDPGVPLVYLGFAILMPATLLSVLPFGQVWAALGEGEEEGQLLISARANRNQPAFEDELTAMILSGGL